MIADLTEELLCTVVAGQWASGQGLYLDYTFRGVIVIHPGRDEGIRVKVKVLWCDTFVAKDGEAHTPIPNGTFLNGVTRQRVVKLLRDAGIKVHERSIKWNEFVEADEVFSTGNYSKIAPITRVEHRNLQPGPIMQKARDPYWEYALAGK